MRGYDQDESEWLLDSNYYKDYENRYIKENRGIEKNLKFFWRSNDYNNLQDALNKSIIVAQDDWWSVKRKEVKEAELIGLEHGKKKADPVTCEGSCQGQRENYKLKLMS